MEEYGDRNAIPDPGQTGAEQPEPYAISAASSLNEGRPLVLKHGDGFAVFDGAGDVRAAPGGAEGVYYRDTRHLSQFALRIERHAPILLSSSIRDDNATLTCDLTNPDLSDGEGRLVLAHDLIHLRRIAVPVEGGLLRADQRPQFRRPAAPRRDRRRVRGRFRRPLRGARLSTRPPRRSPRAPDRGRSRHPELHGPRQTVAHDMRSVSIRLRRPSNPAERVYVLDLEPRGNRARCSSRSSAGRTRRRRGRPEPISFR